MRTPRLSFLFSDSYRDDSSFVNGRSRDVIMAEMRQRIDRADGEREVTETIQVRTMIRMRSIPD